MTSLNKAAMSHASVLLQGPLQLRQRGFAAIAAIFLIVVLAALGGFMLTFSNSQQLTAAQDLQGTRAYWAAQAGLEWGVSSVITSKQCPGGTSTSTTRLPIDNFSVCVECSIANYIDGDDIEVISINYFQFKSTARTPVSLLCDKNVDPPVGTIGYVERSVSAAMELQVQK